MERRADFHGGQVDADEFRQELRQAGHFDIGSGMADHGLADLDGRAFFFTVEVQRHAHRDLFVSGDALEVDVHDLRLVRVHLEGAENNEFFLAVKFHRQDRGVELFLTQSVENRIVFELDRRSGFLAAVNNTRQLVRAAKAAARTRTLHVTRGGDDFHWMTPKDKKKVPAVATNGGNGLKK